MVRRIHIGDIYFYSRMDEKLGNSIFKVTDIDMNDEIVHYDIYVFDGNYSDITDDVIITSLTNLHNKMSYYIYEFLAVVIFCKNIRDIRISKYNKVINR